MEAQTLSFDARLAALPPTPGLTPEQAAVVAGVSVATLSRAIKAGTLQVVRSGRQRFVPRDALEEFWKLRTKRTDMRVQP